MENQHRHISGYRDLSEDEIAQMNAVKFMGNALGDMLAHVEALPEVDKRWTAIARTHLQQGIMAAVRAIARPTTF
jgi:hypothetical protein